MKIKDILIGVINMSFKLFFEAIVKLLLGVVLVGILVFLPAGTFDFFNGWLLCGILFIPTFLAGIVMMIKSPDLLKRRLDAKEKLGEQKTVIKLSGLMFVVGFILAGLDFRYSWLPLPWFISIIGSILFIIALNAVLFHSLTSVPSKLIIPCFSSFSSSLTSLFFFNFFSISDFFSFKIVICFAVSLF